MHLSHLHGALFMSKNDKKVIFRFPGRGPKKWLSRRGEPFVNLIRLDYQVRFL